MNLNLYDPPEQWTEEKINDISDEDNRYEFKSGLILDKEKSEFEKCIAKEICALANSFGGTLFLGIKDKTKEFDGVPKLKISRQSTKAWIEDIIPNLLEFRLPNFRVLEVLLSNNTAAKIGIGKTIVSIDVYDSDLAPHRSLKDQIYYYRQGSKSVPAPHHYLAFLWGRTSPNMSNVVLTWFRLYVNEIVKLLEKTTKDFEFNNFNTVDEYVGQRTANKRKVVFFEVEKWNKLNSTLTAKQFLKTFPDLNYKINELNLVTDKFFNRFAEVKRIVEDSPEFESTIRRLYDEAMIRAGFREMSEFKDKPLIEILRLYAGEVFERISPGISQYPEEFKEILVNMTRYTLLNLDSNSQFEGSGFFSFCKENIANQFNESNATIETARQQFTELRNEIAQKAHFLAKEFDDLRYALALKHNTTFE